MIRYIYTIINKLSGKQYIGQTSDTARRKEQHFTNSSNTPLRKDIESLGSDNFDFQILSESDDPISTNYCEMNYIEESARKGVYNISAGGQLVGKNDSFICNECGEIKDCHSLSMMNNNPGIMLFRASLYPSKNIEEIFFLCGDCHFTDDQPHKMCRQTKRFPYSKHLTANALMDLVICYDLSDEMINKLIMIDGKMNQRMAYAFFTKRLGY